MTIRSSARCVLAIAALAPCLILCGAQFAGAQLVATAGQPAALMPLIGQAPNVTPIAAPNYAATANVAGNGPIARLIKNPDQTSGAPPFALADREGTVQRYVEAVPGIELDPYVGQVVVVSHDTGETLLASQLELPPQPMLPMLDARTNAVAMRTNALARAMPQKTAPVQQAQYVDNDDASVQLLTDQAASPPGEAIMMDGPEMMGAMPPGEAYPRFQNGMPPMEASGAWADPSGPYGPMQYGPAMPAMYPDPMQYGRAPTYAGPMMELQPCPGCGRIHPPGGACQAMGRSSPYDCQPSQDVRFFADVEFNFLRPEIADTVVGPLSESLQFSPRIVAGVNGFGILDARVRYWHYGRDSDVPGPGDVRIQFNVFDLEALHRFYGRRSQAIVAAGVRFADIGLTDNEAQKISTDLFGLTMAADGYTPLRTFPDGEFGWVYGGRLSVLRGNWGGDQFNDFVPAPVNNDNVVATELYAGLQCAKRCRNMNVYARAAFEMQNWRSDVFAPAADVESIGFIGPGLSFGADF